MAIRSFGYGTDVGLSRKRNEDNFCVAPEIGLWAVADGMGGYKGGKTASRIAVKQLAEDIVKGIPLSESIPKIHHVIINEATANPEIKGMGSTVVAMITNGYNYEIAWVGDSRAYLWNGHVLKQITRDHSYVQYLINEGIISESEAVDHPARHAITQALGTEELEDVEVEVISGVFQKNEKIMLCSDGLTNEVDDEQISKILLKEKSSQAAVDSLINKAKNNGGSDNITVILVSTADDNGIGGNKENTELEETIKNIR
ncbi:MAG: Stp1/IreP family PP2C-type Ser/Thr phosphatase [Desulfobacteraceae bacterium]|nr:Stp1/IreP family PP2C-type Ser/Thr phosphatase [Desulfobacteraceae bacterium]MBC2754337.1 Stp1/IreP family PP2C-type Ser/Thr phosphatase [Desulfobacteraceae bacterium]